MGYETILIVDDEPAVVQVIRDRLVREGFEVRSAGDGAGALGDIACDPPDLAILDLMLPDMDGFEVLRRLRRSEAGRALPVIVLTARDDDVDVIVGLELGADDYVVKPFNPRELAARVRAVLRRRAEALALAERVASLEARLGETPAEPAMPSPPTPPLPGLAAGEGGPSSAPASPLSRAPSAGAAGTGGTEGGPGLSIPPQGLYFDTPSRRAWFEGRPLDLRLREYDLLYYLAQHRGQVIGRSALLDAVWGCDEYIDERTVDVHIHRLRQKLAEIDPTGDAIQTERGLGYRLAI